MRTFVVAVVWLLAASVAFAQGSSGTGAKKPVPRSFTNDDLGSGGNVAMPGATDGAPAPKSADGEKGEAAGDEKKAEKTEKTEEEESAEAQKAQAAWRQQMDAAQKDLAAVSTEIPRVQGLLNAAAYSPGIGTNTAEVSSKLAELLKKKAELSAKVEDLAEQGRRSGWR